MTGADAVGGAGEVALNCRAAVRTEIGGVERYARELTARLPALAPGRYRSLVPPAWLAHGAGHLWEQAVLPGLARGCRLLYSPANLAPALAGANVVVIHDLAALVHPEAYSRAYVAYQRRMLPAIARRAALVITVSEFSRGELRERLRLGAERIGVVAPGVGKPFGPDVDPAPARRRLGIDGAYVLAVGTASARKNHGVLAEAARALRGRGIELLVAGSERGYLRSADSGLRRLGYVPEAYLPGLYAGALALAMPSLHEGFGLPVIEAMASGTPVVAAAAGALPETCGGAALLVDPGDAGGFAQALLSAACEDGERARLVAAGLERAAAFSWDASARATDAAIAGLLAGADQTTKLSA